MCMGTFLTVYKKLLAETYLEPSRISTMEILSDVRLGSKYTFQYPPPASLSKTIYLEENFQPVRNFPRVQTTEFGKNQVTQNRHNSVWYTQKYFCLSVQWS